MEIVKKIIPTCVKENLERKSAKAFQEEKKQPDSIQPFSEQVPLPNEKSLSPKQNLVPIDEIFVKNIALARELKRLVFGRNGELSLLLSYVYQTSVLRQLNSSLREEIERVLPIQFETYKSLSKWINIFGSRPTLTDGRGNVWTGRNVDSSANPQVFLERTIRILQKRLSIIQFLH